MSSVEKESELYPTVREWMEKKSGLNCHKTWKNRGIGDVRPDVIGLRHAGGHLRGDFELITVEVKKSSKRFLTSAGQAGANGVYADRTYLCCLQGDKSFNDDDIDVASHLGIGLLEINGRNKVERVLTAPARQPIARKRQEFLSGLDFVICQICNIPFPTSGDPNREGFWGGVTKESDRTSIKKALEKGYGYNWWYGRTDKKKHWVPQYSPESPKSWNRRYICPDCVLGLFWDFNARDD